MSSDITDRLRADHPAEFSGCDPSFDLRHEAANEIERLRREHDAMRTYIKGLAHTAAKVARAHEPRKV